MRSERVPFTDGETPFPNHAQVVLSSFGDMGDARGGSDAVYGVMSSSEDAVMTADDGVASSGDDTAVSSTVAGPSDGTGYADGTDVEVGIPCTGDVHDSADDGIGSADADPRSSYMVDVLPEGIEVINGIAYIKQVPVVRRQVLVRVNRPFKDRLKVIAVLERRDLTAVVEEAIRIFMLNPVCEPRPYLPPEFDEMQTCRLTFYMDSDQEEPLRERARMERREVMDLVRRALVDYVEASLFDPKPRALKESSEGHRTGRPGPDGVIG